MPHESGPQVCEDGQDPAVLVGHSLGGYVTLRVAQKSPELVRALVLIATGPGFRNEVARTQWNQSALALDIGREADPTARHLGIQTDSSVVAGLNSIVVPTLVMVGSNDRSFLAAKDYLIRKMLRATGVVIEGGGHSIHKTHSEHVNRVILEFLRTHALV